MNASIPQQDAGASPEGVEGEESAADALPNGRGDRGGGHLTIVDGDQEQGTNSPGGVAGELSIRDLKRLLPLVPRNGTGELTSIGSIRHEEGGCKASLDRGANAFGTVRANPFRHLDSQSAPDCPFTFYKNYSDGGCSTAPALLMILSFDVVNLCTPPQAEGSEGTGSRDSVRGRSPETRGV